MDQSKISEILDRFAKEENLGKAASDMLYDLFGITCYASATGRSQSNYFQKRDYNFKYIETSLKYVTNIWEIGGTVDVAPEGISYIDFAKDSKYPYMNVYACEIAKDANFSRRDVVAITRAFNIISSKSKLQDVLKDKVNIPVIVVFRQGDLLSIASCERNDRKDSKEGEAIGKVTALREVKCSKTDLHAGHRQILARIADDVKGCTTFDDLYKKWLKSFNIDVLSDAFFDGYKAIYEDIIEYVTGKRMKEEDGKWIEKSVGEPCDVIMSDFSHFAEPEKTVRDYVKNLMGRLVFIQFLQKKGWMGVPEGDNWIGGDPEFLQKLFEKSDKKDTFVDDVLEPLFDDLNNPRPGDLVTHQNVCHGLKIKVPYLNGGLFELSDVDGTKFPLPSQYIKRLLDFFASYNFTIDENAPDDAEIGVDPEMLGRIFENLLEDNKDKGAFYTPKEIVQYMCQESLIAYLQSGLSRWDLTLAAIRDFVTNHDVNAIGGKDSVTAQDILELLKAVKICDPAIGSGAFPMGMLHELYACRNAIEGISQEKAVEIKSQIIQNNIYGVDIEKGAVDIARLRFWLSLIVDETAPHALPNMDFKIMQGNSLLEQYEDVNLSGMSLDEQNKKKAKKGQAWQTTIAFDEQIALNNIQTAINRYYGTDDHKAKLCLRNVINDNVKSYILNLKGCTPDIQSKINNLPIPNDKFFLWHIYFKEVFDMGGFDIVIGNPPYIDSETMVKVMPKERELYAKKFNCASGNWDMFIAFIEFGISLLKKSGIFSNIIPNKLIAAKYGVELRKHLSTKHIIEIRDYSRIDVFEDAAVYPITIILRNDNEMGNTLFTIMENRIDVKQSNVARSIELSKNSYWDPFFADSQVFNLISKINSFNPLKTLPVEVLGAATVADAYEIKNIVQDNSNIKGFKLVNSGTIDPNIFYWGIRPCRYIKGSYIHPIVPYIALKSYSQVRFNQSKSTKIIIASMTTRYEACLDTTGEYIAGKSTTIITGDKKILYKLTAIINSKLASYWLNIVFNSLKMSGGAINIGKNELQMLPIPSGDTNFENLMKEVIDSKSISISNDTSSLESKIDRLVYELYGLTNAEVKIIDPNEKTTGTDKDLFKA